MKPNAEKILIVGPAWIGDMVMAQTLYKLLRHLYPDCQIDVVAPPQTVVLLSRMPEVHTAWSLSTRHGEWSWRVRYQLAKTLRQEQYTRALVLPNSWKSALVPFLARIPVRTGWIGEQRFGLLNDIRRLDKSALPLMIQRFAALAYPANTHWATFAAQFNFSTLPWPALMVDQQQGTALLARLSINLTTQPVLAICPGAEFGPAKRWPLQHYTTLAQYYLQRGWAVWLLGSPKEQQTAQDIMQDIPYPIRYRCVNWVSKTTLTEAIDLLAKATVVVTNDSGLMHLAAAVDKPLVVLYGSSSPKFTPPLSLHAQVLSLNLNCSPCFQRECPLEHLKCLQDLLPAQVIEVINTNMIRLP